MANYPTSVSSNSNLYVAVNGLQTTLASPITNSQTTITLTSTSGFPTTGLVTIENNEVVSYTGISGADLTGCTRGADGTTALAHSTGVTVGATVVAAHHNLLKDEIIAIETALGANLANVFPATATTGSGSVVLQTSPTINSPTLTTPTLGTPASGVLTNATGLPLTTGVTGVLPNANTTATSNATASTIASRDANSNVKVNEMIENFSTTATAAGTTTLTAASSPIQQFTGTTTQTVVLPDATTLSTGFYFTILNRSTGSITVNKNGGTLQSTIATTAQATFVCTSTATAAGTWDTSTSSAGSATAYREDYVVGTALNNYTGSSTVFDLVTPYSVAGNSLIVTLDGDIQTIGATVDYQETNSTRVTFNNALVTGQKVSFIFQTATSSGGTVNSGTAGQLAYYPATGPTVSGTNDPTAIASINSTFIGMGRNRVINGAMSIDQVNAGASKTIDLTANIGILDMWTAVGQTTDGVYTTQRLSTTPPTGFKFYNHIAVTTADASIGAAQRYYIYNAIEGQNIIDFSFGSASAKTITLSFWVRSSLTGTFGGSIQNGASNRSYVFNYTVNSANTWEQKTVTLTGDTSGTWATDNTVGLYSFFDLGSGSNFENTAGSWVASEKVRSSGNVHLIGTNAATWDLTGVQIEIGSTATAFESRPLAIELALCQRYYEKSYNYDVAIGANGAGTSWSATFALMASNHVQSHQMHFKIPKRTDPTMSFWTPDGATSGSWLFYTSAGVQTNRAVTGNHINQAGFDVDNATASDIYAQGQWAADARL